MLFFSFIHLFVYLFFSSCTFLIHSAQARTQKRKCWPSLTTTINHEPPTHKGGHNSLTGQGVCRCTNLEQPGGGTSFGFGLVGLSTGLVQLRAHSCSVEAGRWSWHWSAPPLGGGRGGVGVCALWVPGGEPPPRGRALSESWGPNLQVGICPRGALEAPSSVGGHPTR